MFVGAWRGSRQNPTQLTVALIRRIIEDKGYAPPLVLSDYQNAGLSDYNTSDPETGLALLRCGALSVLYNNEAVLKDCLVTNSSETALDCNFVYTSCLRLLFEGSSVENAITKACAIAQTTQVKGICQDIMGGKLRTPGGTHGGKWCVDILYVSLLTVLQSPDISTALALIGTIRGGNQSYFGGVAAGLIGAREGYARLIADPTLLRFMSEMIIDPFVGINPDEWDKWGPELSKVMTIRRTGFTPPPTPPPPKPVILPPPQKPSGVPEGKESARRGQIDPKVTLVRVGQATVPSGERKANIKFANLITPDEIMQYMDRLLTPELKQMSDDERKAKMNELDQKWRAEFVRITNMEKKDLADNPPCKSQAESFTRLDMSVLTQLLRTEFYNAALMEVLTCVIANVGGMRYVSPYLIRKWIDSYRILVQESEGSTVIIAPEQKNGTAAFTIKVNNDERRKLEGLHETFIGARCLNPLRAVTPGFAYVMGDISCSDVYINRDRFAGIGLMSGEESAKGIATFCVDKVPTVPYVVYEFIAPSQSLAEYIKTATGNQYLDKLYQVCLLLRTAFSRCKFTHYDLHANNVMVRRPPNTTSVLIPVETKRGSTLLQSDGVATLIDYAAAHAEYKGQPVGSPLADGERRVTTAFPMHDVFFLLMRSAQIAMRPDPTKYTEKQVPVPESTTGETYTQRVYASNSQVMDVIRTVFRFFNQDNKLEDFVDDDLVSLPFSDKLLAVTHDDFIEFLEATFPDMITFQEGYESQLPKDAKLLRCDQRCPSVDRIIQDAIPREQNKYNNLFAVWYDQNTRFPQYCDSDRFKFLWQQHFQEFKKLTDDYRQVDLSLEPNQRRISLYDWGGGTFEANVFNVIKKLDIIAQLIFYIYVAEDIGWKCKRGGKQAEPLQRMYEQLMTSVIAPPNTYGYNLTAYQELVIQVRDIYTVLRTLADAYANLRILTRYYGTEESTRENMFRRMYESTRQFDQKYLADTETRYRELAKTDPSITEDFIQDMLDPIRENIQQREIEYKQGVEERARQRAEQESKLTEEEKKEKEAQKKQAESTPMGVRWVDREGKEVEGLPFRLEGILTRANVEYVLTLITELARQAKVTFPTDLTLDQVRTLRDQEISASRQAREAAGVKLPGE